MADAHAAHELKLYIDNDGDLHRRQTTSILKNLVAKRARGIYQHDLGVKLFSYLAEEGAKKYAREFGSDQPWNKMFDVSTRKQAAEELANDFETEAGLGNYDQLLPKKYQGKKGSGKQVKSRAPVSQHARKRLQWKTPPSVKVVWSPVKQNYLALWPGQGRIENQDVLKAANAEEMHDWLRSTYGASYGLANHVSQSASSTGHARKKRVSPRSARPPQGRSGSSGGTGVLAKDIRDFRGFLRNASDSQVQGIYDKERHAGRNDYAELAAAEADRRGISLDVGDYDDSSSSSVSSGLSADDIRDFRGFLRNASDSQVQGIYEKERRAGRDEYAELALAEAEGRGITVEGPYHHARRKSPAQLNREIAAVLGRRRYRP